MYVEILLGSSPHFLTDEYGLQEEDLPFPDKPWYRFEALPIGPHLPPANKEKCYTPEMCIPIFPNTNHPTSRDPVHPEQPFPYGNCYHWIDTEVRIRVRGRPEGFDETNAVRISGKTQILLSYMFTPDYLRAMADVELAQKKALEAEQADAQTASIPKSSMDIPRDVPHEVAISRSQEGNGDAASLSSSWSRSSRSARGPMSSVDDIMRMDIFTGPDEDLDLVPLVDLWPDLTDNLKEEDIPSPLELYGEIKTIQG